MCERVCALVLTTGMTWVTPSPESRTVPVSVLSPTCREVQEAAKASTALVGGWEGGREGRWEGGREGRGGRVGGWERGEG